MRGLILKDFYMTWAYCRIFLVVVLVVGVFGGQGELFFMMYPAVLLGMMPMTIYSYDERERWCAYALTMPLSRKSYVSAKYLYGGSMLAAYALLLAAVMFLTGASAGDCAAKVSLSAVLGTVSMSTTLPLLFKFGAEKARMIHLVMIVLLFSAIGILSSAEVISMEALSRMNFGMTAAVLAAAVLFFLSWMLSVKFYEGREL